MLDEILSFIDKIADGIEKAFKGDNKDGNK